MAGSVWRVTKPRATPGATHVMDQPACMSQVAVESANFSFNSGRSSESVPAMPRSVGGPRRSQRPAIHRECQSCPLCPPGHLLVFWVPHSCPWLKRGHPAEVLNEDHRQVPGCGAESSASTMDPVLP